MVGWDRAEVVDRLGLLRPTDPWFTRFGRGGPVILRTAMDAGHAKGKDIKKETALQGVGIPLHAGAEKFYKEIGLIK